MSSLLKYIPENGLLIRRREELGLSQEAVAKKAGITLKQYQSYESCVGREFSSSSMLIVNVVLTVLELDPTSFANGKYVFKPVTEDDPPYIPMQKLVRGSKNGT